MRKPMRRIPTPIRIFFFIDLIIITIIRHCKVSALDQMPLIVLISRV